METRKEEIPIYFDYNKELPYPTNMKWHIIIEYANNIRAVGLLDIHSMKKAE